jgi:hypothetical protein
MGTGAGFRRLIEFVDAGNQNFKFPFCNGKLLISSRSLRSFDRGHSR